MLNCLEKIYDSLFGLNKSKDFINLLTSKKCNDSKIKDLSNAIFFLSNHHNYQLKKTIQNELKNLNSDEILEVLQNSSLKALETNQTLFNTCKKIMSDEIWVKLGNSKIAARNLIRKHEGLEQVPQKYSSFQPSIFQKSFSKINQIIDEITRCIYVANHVNMDHIKHDSWQAQQQITFFRKVLKDSFWMIGLVYGWIKSGKKSEILINRLVRHIQKIPKVGDSIPETVISKTIKITRFALPLFGIIGSFSLYQFIINRNQKTPHFLPFFKLSLNRVLLEKKHYIPPVKPFSTEQSNCVDYSLELKKILSCPRKAACIIGPAGVGKSELIERFTIDSIQQKLDYVIFSGKMTDFIGGGGFDHETLTSVSAFDMVLLQLKNTKNGQVILFIDEVAVAFKNNQLGSEKPLKSNPMAEILIKLIDEEKVKLIFATTEKEYNNYLRTPELAPLNERIDLIEIKEPSKPMLQAILKNKANEFLLKENCNINVTQEAIDKIIEISEKLPGANPRKSVSLLTNFMSEIKQYSPSKLTNNIQLTNQKIRGLEELIKIEMNKNEKVLFEKNLYSDVDEEMKIKHQKEQEKLEQDKTFQKIHALTVEIDALNQRCFTIAKEILTNKNPNLEKELSFLLNITIPSIRKFQEIKIKDFNKKYSENMIVNLDSEAVDQLSKKIIQNMVHSQIFTFLIDILGSKSEVRSSKYGITHQQVETLISSLKENFKNQNNHSIFDICDESVKTEYTEQNLIDFFTDQLQLFKCEQEKINFLSKAIVEKLISLFPFVKSSLKEN